MELIPVSFLQGVTARSIELNNTPADRTQFLESEREMCAHGQKAGEKNQSKKTTPPAKNLYCNTYMSLPIHVNTCSFYTCVLFRNIHNSDSNFFFQEIC